MDVSRSREDTKLESAVHERFGSSSFEQENMTDAEKSTAEQLTTSLQQVRRRFMITDILNGSALDSKKDNPLGTAGGGLDMRLFFPHMAAAAVANYAAAEKAEGGGDSDDENDEAESEDKEDHDESGNDNIQKQNKDDRGQEERVDSVNDKLES